MPRQDPSLEIDAARHVTAVLGGRYELNDNGSEPGQYDVQITTPDRRVVALEVTRYGGGLWKRTWARIRTERSRGTLAGEALKHQWWVVIPTGIGIRDLQPRLGETLERLERAGKGQATSNYEEDDPILRQAAAVLRELRVNSVQVWEASPPKAQPRILVSQSDRRIGTSGSLPGAIAAVFEKRDNQTKLARADADERHLYVFMEDAGAGAVLREMWPLPAAPSDPEGVIDLVWVYSTSSSAYLFKAQPGGDDWVRFVAATGAEANPAG